MGRKPRVDRTPEENWQIVQDRDKEREFVGKLPEKWDRSALPTTAEDQSFPLAFV